MSNRQFSGWLLALAIVAALAVKLFAVWLCVQ